MANVFKTRCCNESVAPLKPTSIVRQPHALNLEPEVHIERYGIDHYVDTMFPYDTAAQRIARKRHLLSFPCLSAREQRFQSHCLDLAK